MRNKIFRISSFVASLLIVIGGFVYLSSGDNPFFTTQQAEAKEAVDRAFVKMSDLSDEERKDIEAKINANLEGSLEEARSAPDLRIITAEEVGLHNGSPKEGKDMKLGVFKAVKDEKSSDNAESENAAFTHGTPMLPENVTYLRYTDKDGQEVTLGIDENDKPVMKVIRLDPEKADGKVLGFPAQKIKEFKTVKE